MYFFYPHRFESMQHLPLALEKCVGLRIYSIRQNFVSHEPRTNLCYLARDHPWQWKPVINGKFTRHLCNWSANNQHIKCKLYWWLNMNLCFTLHRINGTNWESAWQQRNKTWACLINILTVDQKTSGDFSHRLDRNHEISWAANVQIYSLPSDRLESVSSGSDATSEEAFHSTIWRHSS